MSRHQRHTNRHWSRVRFVDPHQLVLGLPITRDELRASLTVIRNESPEPIETVALRAQRRKAA